MLSVTGMLNYMGKIDLPLNDTEAQNNGIAVRPVLLRKGNTRLGLYGIGNVKDQRMHFELRSNRVRMYMPKDKDSWFNVLLLHQNRYVMCLASMAARSQSQQRCARTTAVGSRGYVR